MAGEQTNIGRPGAAGATAGELIDALSRFEGPLEQFLANMLALQCRLAPAAGAAILGGGEDNQARVMAVHPPIAQGANPPTWLSQSLGTVRDVLTSGKPVVQPLRSGDEMYGQPAQQHLVAIPLRGGQGVRGAAAYLIEAPSSQALSAARERLELTVSLLSVYEMRLTLRQRQQDTIRLRMAMEVLACVNDHDRFTGAAMAFCNEIASRWQCDRVGLGFLKGRYVHLKALSHTEKFSRKMKLVQDVESAMEECLDQDVEIAHPTSPESTYVSRSAAKLSSSHGPTAILSLPLRKAGECVAVVTVERPVDKPFTTAEAEAMRLTCDLTTARMDNLFHQDRWFGARAAGAVRNGLAVLVGPRHTWVKVAAMLICAVLAFVIFAKGDYQADAPFVFEATEKQIIPAPFDGFLDRAYVEEGDVVVGVDQTPWLLEASDIADWKALVSKIRAQADVSGPSPGKFVWLSLDKDIKKELSADEIKTPALHFAFGKICELMQSEGFFEAVLLWEGFNPSGRQGYLLDLMEEDSLNDERRAELNRTLLVSAFSGKVAAGPTVLAQLDTSDLRLQLAGTISERESYLTRARAMMGAYRTGEAQIAKAEADKLHATIVLLEHRIRKATILSACSGRVLLGELKEQLDAPVKKGDVLFEVGPPDALRATLSMGEDQIADVVLAYQNAIKKGEVLRGQLAAVGRPGQRIDFDVERIDPVARVVDQANVFGVRAKLQMTEPWMRPGMEGVAKIHLGRRRYIWLGSRRIVNWVRMKLWL